MTIGTVIDLRSEMLIVLHPELIDIFKRRKNKVMGTVEFFEKIRTYWKANIKTHNSGVMTFYAYWLAKEHHNELQATSTRLHSLPD